MDFPHSAQAIATLILVLGSTAVGVKLLLLSRRTRQLPEMFLGMSILLSGSIGYGVLITALVLRGSPPMAPADVPMGLVALYGVGRVIYHLGVTFFLVFVLYVFRRGSTWAYLLAGVAMLMLWGGFAVGAAQGSLRSVNGGAGSAAWFCEYGVIWAYPLWNAIESFRYYGLMRRRAALGLSDPMVMNRFLLWGLASVFMALATWAASNEFVFINDTAWLAAMLPAIRVATASLGMVSVTCLLLAFLPPTWYRRRIVSMGASPAPVQ